MKMARGPILDLSVNHGLGTVNTIAKRAQCSKNNIYLLSPHIQIYFLSRLEMMQWRSRLFLEQCAQWIHVKDKHQNFRDRT